MSKHHGLTNTLKIALIINLIYVLVEVIIGFYSNSLALLGDAGHNFLHASVIGFTWFGVIQSRRPADSEKTFGYKRVEILVAFVNALLLMGIGGFIIYKGVLRFFSPVSVLALPIIIVSITDIILDVGVAFLLKEFSRNMSVKSMIFHVLGDVGSSVGVIVAGLLILFTGIYQIDSLIAIVIGFIILISSIKLINDSSHLLLEGVPKDTDIEKIRRSIKKIKEVIDVKDLHVWCLSSTECSLSAHVVVNHENYKKGEKLLDEIKNILDEKFDIHHTTIQIDCEDCHKHSHEHG